MAKLTECYNEGSHIHVASHSYRRLKKIRRVARRRFKLTVHEFAPFDHVDCVHVDGSWHYRLVKRSCLRLSCAGWYSATAHDKKRHNLAMDAFGARQAEFYAWVLRRYGTPVDDC